MLEQAMNVLGVAAKDLQEFEVEDPFNPHVLRGYLCRRSDHRYGAMYVTHVDGTEEPQLIYATPKLSYPFDRAGTYRFPPAREVLVYEKFDGTNVLAYYYRTRGQKCLTFKLRLSPVMRNSRHGPFLDFWREILAVYPDIPKLPAVNDCAISFELFGGRNKHLVVYDVPLSVAVLFGVGPTGAIRPPADLQLLNVPAAPLAARLEKGSDYRELYNSQQAACEQRQPNARRRSSARHRGAGLVHEDAGRRRGDVQVQAGVGRTNPLCRRGRAEQEHRAGHGLQCPRNRRRGDRRRRRGPAAGRIFRGGNRTQSFVDRPGRRRGRRGAAAARSGC